MGGLESWLKGSHPSCHHPASKLSPHEALQIRSLFCLQPPSLPSLPLYTQTSTSTVCSTCVHHVFTVVWTQGEGTGRKGLLALEERESSE